ncbi:MAG: hypothetical protein MJ229_05915 [bacterium]|nr:hypothetical protein [bacterium]
MSSIVNACYYIDNCYKTAEYNKQKIALSSELDECMALADRYNEKLADLEEAKKDGEYYSVFEMKRYEQLIDAVEYREECINKKIERINTSSEISSAQASGFKDGIDSNEFTFSFK